MSRTRDGDLLITGPVPARTCIDGWVPAGRPCIVGNALAFVDELRWILEVVAMHMPLAAGRPQAAVVPRPAPAWGRNTS